jgi:hypothetical protein
MTRFRHEEELVAPSAATGPIPDLGIHSPPSSTDPKETLT